MSFSTQKCLCFQIWIFFFFNQTMNIGFLFLLWSRSVGSALKLLASRSFCYSFLVSPAPEGGALLEHTHCTPLSCTVACTCHAPRNGLDQLWTWSTGTLVYCYPPAVPCLAERSSSVFADSFNSFRKGWTAYFCCIYSQAQCSRCAGDRPCLLGATAFSLTSVTKPNLFESRALDRLN